MPTDVNMTAWGHMLFHRLAGSWLFDAGWVLIIWE